MPTELYRLPQINRVIGVDFSGASESGKTAWLAELTVPSSGKQLKGQERLNVESLRRIGRLAGSDARAEVCGFLCERILTADQTLLGMDFPFGLPIELQLGDWPQQLEHVQKFQGDAKAYGRELVTRSQQLADKKHIRRVTDGESRTPFDCYHYRIIYQTFHGMRDVLRPIFADKFTSVLPFQYEKLSTAKRVVVEACPSSTLKRLKLPHQKYKQSGGKQPQSHHLKNRQTILRGVAKFVRMSEHRRRVILKDPGGDALDAVLAAIGSWHAVQTLDHATLANHQRYHREGFVYC